MMTDEKRHQDLMGVLRTILKVQALNAVRDLETKKEKIIFLHEGGLSNAEIGVIVGSSPASVSQTVYEAKKKAKD